jgi:hypothetical protein
MSFIQRSRLPLAVLAVLGAALLIWWSLDDGASARWQSRITGIPVLVPPGAQVVLDVDQSSPFGSSYEYVFQLPAGQDLSCQKLGISREATSGPRDWYNDTSFEIFGARIEQLRLCSATFKHDNHTFHVYASDKYLQIAIKGP